MVNVGGFFASLKLLMDEASFKKGNDSLLSMGKNLAGIVLKATAVVGALAAIVNQVAKVTQVNQQAAWSANMNITALENWQNALKIANVDSQSFTSAIANMNKVFQNLKIGEVDEGFIKSLGMLGLDFSKMQRMSQEERLDAIFKAGAAMKDQAKAAQLIEKVLGSSGKDFFVYTQKTGIGYKQMLDDAKKRQLIGQQEATQANQINRAFNQIGVSLDEASKKILLSVGTALLPYLQDLAKWLQENSGELKKLADAIGKVVGWIASTIGWLATGEQQQIGHASLPTPEEQRAYDKFLTYKGIVPGDFLAEAPAYMGRNFDPIFRELMAREQGKSGELTKSAYSLIRQSGGLASIIPNLSESQQIGIGLAANKIRSVFPFEGAEQSAAMQELIGSIYSSQKGGINLNVEVKVDDKGRVTTEVKASGKGANVTKQATATANTIGNTR